MPNSAASLPSCARFERSAQRSESCIERSTTSTPTGLPSTCTGGHRSEEHTSELQSLMLISYAVFCLKKKRITDQLIQAQKDEYTITFTSTAKTNITRHND